MKNYYLGVNVLNEKELAEAEQEYTKAYQALHKADNRLMELWGPEVRRLIAQKNFFGAENALKRILTSPTRDTLMYELNRAMDLDALEKARTEDKCPHCDPRFPGKIRSPGGELFTCGSCGGTNKYSKYAEKYHDTQST